MAFALWRANHPLQAPSLGKLSSGDEFYWDGSIIGWNVTPLNAEAKEIYKVAMARVKEEKLRVPSAESFEPVKPPKSGMQATSAALTAHVDNPPRPDAQQSAVMSSPPRRKLTPSTDDAPAAPDVSGDL